MNGNIEIAKNEKISIRIGDKIVGSIYNFEDCCYQAFFYDYAIEKTRFLGDFATSKRAYDEIIGEYTVEQMCKEVA